MQLTFTVLFFACTLVMNPLRAIASQETQETKNDLRILELLPNFLAPLAVEPGIPADFIALSPQGNLDPYDWIYWGPKDVLTAYFANPALLQVPILRVKLSPNVVQTGLHSFNHKESLKTFEKEDPREFASITTQWGGLPYPRYPNSKRRSLTFHGLGRFK